MRLCQWNNGKRFETVNVLWWKTLQKYIGGWKATFARRWNKILAVKYPIQDRKLKVQMDTFRYFQSHGFRRETPKLSSADLNRPLLDNMVFPHLPSLSLHETNLKSNISQRLFNSLLSDKKHMFSRSPGQEYIQNSKLVPTWLHTAAFLAGPRPHSAPVSVE